jgi:sialic acid synthase SpsE
LRQQIAKLIDQRPLFIFEMANNHMGSVELGRKIIAALREISRQKVATTEGR